MKNSYFLILLLSITGFTTTSLLAQRGSPEQQLERWAQNSRQREAALKNDPFVGLTVDGTIQPGLFEVKPTGVSTKSILKAAEALIESLTDEQKKETLHPVDSPEWRQWMNLHFYDHWGIDFLDMSETQKELTFDLLRASLSPKGFKLSRDIMKLNHTIGEMAGTMFGYGEWLYAITIMGKPSATEPWGWQVEGHHLIINFFVLGDQVVATPTFIGSEPVTAEGGKYKGISIMQEEQDKALAFAQSLTVNQRAAAVLSIDKGGNDNLTEAFKDNAIVPFEGLLVTDLDKKQTEELREVIGIYINYINEGHAKIRLNEIWEHWDQTYFAWKGSTEDDAIFYYRIHSPVALIEFDHQNPVALRRQFPDRKPVRQHIHAVIRTPNGNDYGKDLLRQHREKHHHN